MTDIKTHYSCAELAAMKLPGYPATERRIRDRVKKDGWVSRQVDGRGGKSGTLTEYQPPAPVMALIRERAMQKLVAESAENQPVRQDLEVVQEELANPGNLKNWQRDVAQARIAICREVERLAKIGGKEKAVQKIIGMAKKRQLPERLQEAAEIANAKKGKKRALSRTSVYRWLGKINADGSAFAQIAPKGREPKELPAWALPLCKLYGQPQKPSLQSCVEKLPDVLPAGVPVPSYSAARRFIEKMSNIDQHRGRMGSREIKSILPFVRRDASGLWPADIYTSDGHTFDAEVAHPAHGRAFRPEITTVLDISTRKAVGWSAGLAESTWTVADALRHACTSSGIPAMFYVDRGAGFTNDLLKNEVTGLAERLGFELTHSIPYNSQARGIIERVQQTIWVKAAKMLPTYMGRDMDTQAKQKTFKITRKDIQISGTSKLLIEWPDFLQFCQQQIDDYNNRPHKSLPKVRGEDGKKRHQTPNEAWEQAINDGFQAVEVEAREQADLFRPYKSCKIIRGEIKLFGNRYFHHDLADYNGENALVGYDIHDASRVWVKDSENRLICIAEFEGNSKSYFPESVVEQARYKRAAAKIKRAETRIEEAQAELDPPHLIEHQPAEQLPVMEVLPAQQRNQLPGEAMHIEEFYDTENIAVIQTKSLERPWFITDSDKYRWMMHMDHRGLWTKHDVAWIRNFVHTDYYWNFYDIFCREQIKWSAEDEYFCDKWLKKLQAEEEAKEDEVSGTQ